MNSSVLAFRLAIVADAIIVFFFVIVGIGIIPLELLNPAWASQALQLCLDNGVNLLIAILLLHLAEYFDPDNNFLKNHCTVFSRLSVYLSFLYLLFIPIQIWVSSSFVNQAYLQDIAQVNLALKKISLVASQVKNAGNYDQLSNILQSSQGAPLPNELRNMPLSQTKKTLLNQISQAKSTIKNSKQTERFQSKLLFQAQLSARNVIISFAYFFSFAALAQRKSASGPLLQEMLAGVSDRLEYQLQKRHERIAEESSLPSPVINEFSEGFLSDADINALQKRGILDSGWLDPSISNQEPRPASPSNTQQVDDETLDLADQNDTYRHASPTFIQRIRFAINPGSRGDSYFQPGYLDAYADLLETQDPAFQDQTNLVNEQTEASASESPSLLDQNQSKTSNKIPKPIGKIADIDYFELLASDESQPESQCQNDGKQE